MDLTHQEQILNKYCTNEMQKLKQICYPKICKIGGISQMDHDDLYSIALDVLRYSVEKYDDLQDCKFSSYLSGNIDRKFSTYVRDKLREKRSGEVQYDEDGNRVFNHDVSLDESIEDGTNLNEKIASDFNIEDNLSEELCISSDDRVDEFLGKLSSIQREIVSLLMLEYKPNEIREKLCISTKEYNEAMKMIKQNKHLSAFNKNSRETKRKVVVGRMEETKVLEVMEIDTTDSYRMDKYSLLSLLNKKTDGEIDCNYISQRAPFQWQPMQINKFYTRILNNQPIPEIIICETVEDGEKVAYLIDGLQRLSYAEWFKENRIKIGDKGAEFTKIKYRKYELDENGNKVVDEKGRARYEIDTFDVSGKYYKDLPEFLQKRFDNFNINVTTFFNCTEEIIDYHIRNYNNHVAMSKSQYGITNVNNFTSRNIKLISEEHDFFKDIVKCTATNKTKGVLEEVVVRSIMALDFMNDWKRDLLDALLYIDENAKDEHYKKFRALLDCLYKAGCNCVKDMFTSTNAHVWFAIYDKFSKLGVDDSKFIGFMEEFNKSMQNIDKAKKNKEDYVDNFVDEDTYEVFKRRNTKDKATVIDKIEYVYTLLLDYLHIEVEEMPSEDNIIDKNTQTYIDEFCKTDLIEASKLSEAEKKDVALESLKAVDNVTDDALIFADSANEWLLNIENGENLITRNVIPALIGFVKYIYANNNYSDENGIEFLKDYLHTISITNSPKVNLDNMIAITQRGAA